MALTPLQILQRDKENAARYAERASKARTRHMLERAQLELTRRLRHAEGLQGPGADSFTAHQMQAALAQVRAVLVPLTHELRGAAVDLGKEAAEKAAGDALDYIGRAEQGFRGSTQPLPFDTASMLDVAVRGSEATVLRRLANDPNHPGQQGVLARYGLNTMGKFEEAMQQRLLQGKSWAEARDDLTSASPFLQGAPVSWAERILRTETMNAHNAAGHDALMQVQAVVGEMLKVLCATFDARTGADSYAVHGQVRRASEPFQSWFGSYMHPPNRPNDREVVVPHHASWPFPPSLHPLSDGQVAARWSMEGHKQPVPPRPLMSTVDLAALRQQPSAPMAEATVSAPMPAPAEPTAATVPEPRAAPLPSEPTVTFSIPAPAPVPLTGYQRELSAALAPMASPLVEHAKVSKLGGGANESKKLAWTDESNKRAQAVWKPASGEELSLRANIKAGTYHKREAAMFALDKLMGGETVVPPTVSRTLKGDVGSLQKFQFGAKTADKFFNEKGSDAMPLEDPTVRRMHLLDLISGNTDRHRGNWMIDKRGKAVAIDNGLAFPAGPPLRVLVPGQSYDPRHETFLDIDAAQKALLSKLDPPAVAKVLSDHGLEPEAVRGAVGRLMALKNEPDAMSRERDAQKLEGHFSSGSTRAITEDWAQSGWQRSLSPEQYSQLFALIGGIKSP